MSILVATETIILAFVLVLIAGLLRSHAEILRRLPRQASSVIDDALRTTSVGGTPPRSDVQIATEISGFDLRGREVSVPVSGRPRDLLVGFLTSGCGLCQDFWDALKTGSAHVPSSVDLVLITKDRSDENLSKLRDQASDDLMVVMSSAAWDAHDVPLNPYFILIEGSSGRILGEGAARTWEQVLSLVEDAINDIQEASQQPASSGPTWRQTDVDAVLAAAGIGPDHPSLYDSRWSDDQFLDENLKEAGAAGKE